MTVIMCFPGWLANCAGQIYLRSTNVETSEAAAQVSMKNHQNLHNTIMSSDLEGLIAVVLKPTRKDHME